MGLAFRPSAATGLACWSYTGFHEFRCRLAKSLGFDLDAAYKRGGKTPVTDSEGHDLVALFNHSDCDGEMTPEECGRCAQQLRDVCLRWPTDPGNPAWYDRLMGLRLADAMDDCATLKVPLLFR